MARRFVFFALAFVPAIVVAQQPRPSQPLPNLQELAGGWAALAAGKAPEAERVSDSLLRVSPRSHEGIALKIHARLMSPGVAGALDAYEEWLQQARHEDVFLLEPVALGLLNRLAAASDPAVRSRALELLAAAGDDNALAQLNAISSGAEGGFNSDSILARRGDATALQRLARRVKDGGRRDVSDAIDALRDAGAKDAAGVILTALEPMRPLPTKMAAARALAELGNTDSVPRLRESLKDPDPPVRVMAAAALARLGDDAGAEIVRRFENSPVGDLRLLAVEATAAGNPTGPWVGVATAVLQDPDPLVKLRAATLLLQHAADPHAAGETLHQALGDSNPAMRYAAAQILDRVPAAALERDLPTLRKLMRDASALVQLEAAGGILRVAGAI